MADSFDEAVQEYCRAKQELSTLQRKCKDEHLERVDAEKTLSNLLLESMTKNGVSCICMGDEVGEKKYIKVVPPVRKSMKIKTEDDLLSLVEGMSKSLDPVSKSDIPAAVVFLFKKRALERGESGKPRLVLTHKPVRRMRIDERDMLATETKNLSTQYVEAKHDLLDERDQMRPLKEKQKETERTLLPLLPSEGTLVKVSGGEGKKEKTIRLQRFVKEPNAAPAGKSASKSIGIRSAICIVREAAEEASEVRDTVSLDFDEALKACILKRIRSFREQVPVPRPKIKTTRAVFTTET